MMVKKLRFAVLTIILILSLAACSSREPYSINLMPAPDVYDDGNIDPFIENNIVDTMTNSVIFYATDRAPAEDGDKEKFYRNTRGHVLRLGMGKITMGKPGMSWEEAKRVSLLKNRSENYPLKVTGINEFGIFDRSLNVFIKDSLTFEESRKPAIEYASRINEKLAVSKRKDIYIYVHGFKVVFENPLLVATELWHFLGYDGVFISYAWPSTPSNFAYFSDVETAKLSSRNFRFLLEYLSEETDVEKIHIIGYSAGSRVVIDTLFQLALKRCGDEKPEFQKKLKIGHAILVGSDYDLEIFLGYVLDGLADVPEHLSIYRSGKDNALGISSWLFRLRRLGQAPVKSQMEPDVIEYLNETKSLSIVDVSDAKYASSGNGHAYFRQSPWVSSDILMTLMYDLKPQNRGIIMDGDLPIWKFPEDYNTRLRSELTKLNSAY